VKQIAVPIFLYGSKCTPEVAEAGSAKIENDHEDAVSKSVAADQFHFSFIDSSFASLNRPICPSPRPPLPQLFQKDLNFINISAD
jgi:hypothetical protein